MNLPVATEWFRAESAGDGVTRLVEPHITPVLESNVWHVRGRDADLLVDAANGVGTLAPVIAALAGGRPVIAVATHGHFDHTGGLHEFDDRRCHELDADDVRAPWPMTLVRGRFPDGADRDLFGFYGYATPDVAVQAVPREGFDLEGWTSPGAEPTAFLAEGDVIDLGDRRFEVLHVPGHTAGSISLWEPETGLLFTGDAVYAEDRMSWDDREAFEASLRRLADVPARRVHAGHNGTLDGAELREVIGKELLRRGN